MAYKSRIRQLEEEGAALRASLAETEEVLNQYAQYFNGGTYTTHPNTKYHISHTRQPTRK